LLAAGVTTAVTCTEVPYTLGEGVDSVVTTIAGRANTQAAPALKLVSCVASSLPPISSVEASADNATELPWPAAPAAPVPNSAFPSCRQVLAEALKAQTDPVLSKCHTVPRNAALPSRDSATRVMEPYFIFNGGSSLTEFQTLPWRTCTQAAS